MECLLDRNTAVHHGQLRRAWQEISWAKYRSVQCKIQTYRPCTISPYSLVTVFGVTMVSPLGAKPQAPGPKALFNILLYLISGRYMIPSGLISTSEGVTGSSNASCASLLNASPARPWKELDQSTVFPESSTDGAGGRGSSERPCARERTFLGFTRPAVGA